MTSLSDKPISGEVSLKFEDQIYDDRKKKLITRRRIIEGSKEYGLPTATDDSVILALIQLTKLKSGFSSREVAFSRFELIQLLAWPNKGQSYDRIAQSLHRLASVTYHFENSWWDNHRKAWTTKIFGLIDNVDLNDSREIDSQGGLFTSRIVWNQTVLDSFQAGYLRSLDFRLAISFKHAISMRIYRFMGKRFHLKPDWLFDLKDFSYEHIGISRNYEGGIQIARKLQPAIEELEAVGFLLPLPQSERFIKKGRDWSIRLMQQDSSTRLLLPGEQAAQPAPSPLMEKLTSRGITEKTAAELIEQYPASVIEAKIDAFDWEMTQPKPPKRPAGYLVKSISDGYSADPKFVPKVERDRQAAETKERERLAAEDRRRRSEADARERQERQQIATYWQGLSHADQAKLEAEAKAQATPEDMRLLGIGPMQKIGLGIIRDNFIRTILAEQSELEAEA